jgi:hypothetical protein
MSSDELPPELAARWVADGVGKAWTTAVGLDVGVITGNRLPTLSPGTADGEAAVGLGVTVAPTGVDGSAAVAAGDAAGRDDGSGAGPLDAVAPVAVTAMTPTACALVGGLVDESTVAVRLTHAGPLDGVPIPALRVNDDGMTSVPSDPTWHEAVPSPLGQKPVNSTLPADAVSVTDTPGAAPSSAWTCTVKWAWWPRATLLADG